MTSILKGWGHGLAEARGRLEDVLRPAVDISSWVIARRPNPAFVLGGKPVWSETWGKKFKIITVPKSGIFPPVQKVFFCAKRNLLWFFKWQEICFYHFLKGFFNLLCKRTFDDTSVLGLHEDLRPFWCCCCWPRLGKGGG